jgi:hypothetical protein
MDFEPLSLLNSRAFRNLVGRWILRRKIALATKLQCYSQNSPLICPHTALRMQDELRRYSDKLLTEGRAPLEVRVGVNTGEVVVRSLATSR